jgi:precorrin-2 dehydrogenase/sirohydrochlorin ferrochelatase
MRYYPVYLDLQGRQVLVVGAGAVGSRKVKTLLQAGARVTVVSPRATPVVRDLAAEGRLVWHPRSYDAADMDGMCLVFGATDDPDLNRRIEADAGRCRVWCNLAAQPDKGDFILPSVVARGDLLISISTSGASPAVARRLRQELEAYFGEEYAPFLRLMKAIRARLLEREHAPDDHKRAFGRLIDGGLLALVKAGDKDGINALLQSVLGDGFDGEQLMARTPGTSCGRH